MGTDGQGINGHLGKFILRKNVQKKTNLSYQKVFHHLGMVVQASNPCTLKVEAGGSGASLSEFKTSLDYGRLCPKQKNQTTKKLAGMEKMAQWLRAYIALAEDQGSVPLTIVTAFPGDTMRSSGLHRHQAHT